MVNLGILLRSYLPIQPALELAQEAERRGFHSIWVTEGMDSKDAFTQMAAYLMKTQRIRVGSGIVPIYLRTPVLTGMSAVGLAELSGERAILGLGASHPFIVEGGHGAVLKRPLTHMREYVEIIRRLIQEPEFGYQGKVYNVTKYAAPERTNFHPHPFHIPIFIAALRTQMARLAGEVADGVLMNWATTDYLRRAIDIVRDGARSAGRDPSQVTVGCLVAAAVSQNEEAAAWGMRRSLANYVTTMPFYNKMLRDTGFAREMETIEPEVARLDVAGVARKISEETARSIGLFGSPEHVRQGLKAYEETGADLLVLSPKVVEGSDVVQSVADVIETFAPC